MTQETPFILDQFLPYQLAVVAERTSKDFAELYKSEFGLSRSEWRVMAHLSQESSVSVREISERAHLDKSKVSRAVSRLVENGLITKQVSDSDRRLVVLALAPSGRELMDRLTPIAQAFEAELDKRLGKKSEEFRKVISEIMKG